MATIDATIKDLVSANLALEAEAAKAEAEILALFKRAEARAFSRIAELMQTAPNFSTEELQRRLEWYFANIPSNEIAQAQLLYGEGVVSYLDKYPGLGKLAESVLGAGGIPKDFVNIPKELIDALRTRDVTFFNELNAEALRRLDRQLLDSVVIGHTPSNALAQIKGVITGSYPRRQTSGLYEWHAGTYARTANTRFSRQILKAKADELNLETFVYIGPVDSKNRPFCLGIVGGAFTRLEIEELDNGQTGDVFSDGGGFNCRHTWSPVSQNIFDELREDPDGSKEQVQKEIGRQSPEK